VADHQAAAHPDSFAVLARRIAPGSKLLRTWELKGGVSAQVTAFELERRDGRTERLIVRRHGARDLNRNPQLAADEFRLLELLRAAGIPAPTPRYLDARGEIFATPCLVVDYVDGELPSTGVDETELVNQLAAVLTEIHRVDCSTRDLSFLPRRDLAEPPLRSASEAAQERRIRAVLARAHARPQRNASVLQHGDFWPGNTLWRDGRLVAVIDWEDAAIGDPLADVANARLELLWALGGSAMDEFTRRYESIATAIDLTDLPYWDLWAGVRLRAHMAEWGLDNGTATAMRAGLEAFFAQALEDVSTR
jgi:aminoglycoside phosphotransferase (APT) family kinase protein